MKNVRRAVIEDLDALALLFDAYRQFYAQQPDVDGAREFIAARINNDESVIFIAELEGRAVGFVQLYPVFTSVGMRRAWLLNDLFVASNARRNGMAAALMQAAHEMAAADGAAGVLLETQISNTGAQALYEKLGYQRNDTTWFYWLPLQENVCG